MTAGSKYSDWIDLSPSAKGTGFWLLILLVIFAANAHAARTVNSVSLNGASTVTVAPGAAITAAISVTTDNTGGNNDWKSTGWLISATAPGGVSCDNHSDQTSSGTYSKTLNITAPSAPGTYNAYFIAYSDDACSSGASSIYAMAGAVIVSVPLSSALMAEYRFDQCDQYTGAAGEVVDTIGSYPGTPMQGLQNADGGQLFKLADFSSANRYVNVPSGPALGDWSISVWFQMPFAGSAVHSSPYYIIGSVSGGGDLAFIDRNDGYRWGVYSVGGGAGTTYGNFQFNTLSNGWHHMALVGQGTRTYLYVDGTYRDQVSRKVTGTFRYLGTSYDSVGTASGQSWGTPLDEYKIFNVPLSAGQVSSIYSNELAGLSWDGTTRPQPCLVPLAEYHFDEASWNGTAGEVIDNSANGYNASRGGGATTASGSPAYTSGSDSTCNYGRFDMAGTPRAYVQLPAGFPSLGSDFTIAAWIRTTNVNKTGQRVFVRDDNGNGWALSVSDEVAGTLRLFNRSIQYTGASLTGGGAIRAGNVALDTPVVIASNVWYFVAVSVDTANKVVTLYAYNATGALLAKTSASYTGTWGTGTGATSIGNETAASAENGLYFNGNIDEVRVYQAVATQTQIESLRTIVRTCAFTGFDHLRIEHSGAGVTCAPTTLTLKACADASCSSLYSGTVTGTLTATGTPTVNWVGGPAFAIGATGLVTKDVQVTTAGSVAWGTTSVAPVATNGSTCYVGATNSCSFTSNLAGFLFDVPNNASDMTQNITVSAVKQADNSLACTPAFASTSKTINFGCGYSNPVTGTLPVVVGGSNISCGSTTGVSLAFNASGVATTTVRYADVGQMSLTASYTGSGGSEAGLVMTGTDTFIAAPASLSVTPLGPYVAGNNFSVTVAAKNASGNTTPNFGKESTTENVTLGHTLTGPAGGNDPALTGTTTIPDASFQSGNGSATVSDIKWAEVGDISLTAVLASASYLGSGLTANGSAAAGPFKPAYFDTVVTPGTGAFTYSGQPFTVQVTAKNASGGTTQNYKGAYARIVTLSDGNSSTNNSTTLGTFSNASIAAASFNNGVATTNTVSYRFNSKTTAPLEAPASAPLKLRALDTDSVTSSGHTEGTTPIRAGRLRLVNFYGSELLRPRVEYRAEYWDGSRWATNPLDSSNPIVAGNIATGGLTVNGVTALNNGIGFITFNTAAAGSYDIALDLNAAGVDSSCNAAHGGTAANKSWLQGYWSAPANCGGVGAWAQDPNARIRLGASRAPYIYLRERY